MREPRHIYTSSPQHHLSGYPRSDGGVRYVLADGPEFEALIQRVREVRQFEGAPPTTWRVRHEPQRIQ